MYSRMGSIDGYLPARREGLCAQPMLAKQLINQKICLQNKKTWSRS